MTLAELLQSIKSLNEGLASRASHDAEEIVNAEAFTRQDKNVLFLQESLYEICVLLEAAENIQIKSDLNVQERQL